MVNYYNNILTNFPKQVLTIANKFPNGEHMAPNQTKFNINFIKNNNNIFEYKIDFTGYNFHNHKLINFSLICLYNVKTNLFTFQNHKSYQINNIDYKNINTSILNYFENDKETNSQIKYKNLINFFIDGSNTKKLSSESLFSLNIPLISDIEKRRKNNSIIDFDQTRIYKMYTINGYDYENFSITWFDEDDKNGTNFIDYKYSACAILNPKSKILTFPDFFIIN